MYKEYHPSNLFKCDEWYKKDEEKSKSQTEENIAKSMGNIPLIKTNHNFVTNYFFPSAIIERNNLDQS